MSNWVKVVPFEDIPKFAPELFAKLTVRDALRRTKLNEALNHLSEEGASSVISFTASATATTASTTAS